MMKTGWYHSEELSPSDVLVDRFPDSKFSIDRWSSFAREIIQNSLDAQDDYELPVVVEFDLNKNLSLRDIPGGERYKEILEKCKDAASNPHTKSTYLKGLEILSKDKVYCLKVSDKNTKGVKSGRDEAWGALVYDEGKSVKQRAGSAGSHGVGKKAPFIISSCRNVFYATKNKYEEDGIEKSDTLVQGKSILINWVDEKETRRNLMGWFGGIDDTASAKEKVKPLTSFELAEKYPYFVRNDEYGTDVIIVGVNAYSDGKDNDEKLIQRKIINAVIESFFVAVLMNKLVVKVFGVEINASNIEYMLENYYEQPKSIRCDIKASLRVYKESVANRFEVNSKEGDKLGVVNIYFELGNEFNKKYYSLIRSHGMKIIDKRLQRPNQPFTALAVVEGTELNKLLSSLENAAHDDFITKDEEVIPDPKAVYALNEVEKIIAEYIVANTKIDAKEGQEITGISNIITLPGVIASVKKKTNVPVVKKRKIAKTGKGSLGKGNGKAQVKSKPGKKTGEHQKASKQGNKDNIILYEDYKLKPVFMKMGKKYIMKVALEDNVTNAEFVFKSVNSEGNSDNSISDFITDLTYENGQRISVKNGVAKGIKISKDKTAKFILNISRDVAYRMRLEMYCKESDIHE